MVQIIVFHRDGDTIWRATAADVAVAERVSVADIPARDAFVVLSGVDVPAGVSVWPAPVTFGVTVVRMTPLAFARDLDGKDGETIACAMASALATLIGDGRIQTLLSDTSAAFFGANHEITLRSALPRNAEPPRLRDDCFAMPQGVAWVPVDEALARLDAALRCVTKIEEVTTAEAAGRILAHDAVARRANPPAPNSAVDGYGFVHTATTHGVNRLPLVQGRAAAGQPYHGSVPEGAAIRILTGAALPDGVDTVVLEEDTTLENGAVVFDGPVKTRANTRKAGEDLDAGQIALRAGLKLRAPDIALATALGIDRLSVYAPLRVGVLSTGDEIIASPDKPAEPHQIWDANRPMLLALARAWGYEAIDLGHVDDDRDVIAARLDSAALAVDAILTSGGASAGDEDHVSALLRDRGTLSSWRIALKPGRPLALALWDGVPVLGLPGNPVAALVCALIFARPAFSKMAGGGWLETVGFSVPAAFAKNKKAGRREYLRARLDSYGAAEVFASEGSGRISSLSWAEGLVELPDEAAEITPGTPVKFIPYAMFGLV